MEGKARRKQLKGDFKLKEKEQFENTFPMLKEKFKDLFDNLDSALQEEGCSDNLVLTVRHLTSIQANNIDQVTTWLNDNGAYCDCEVLANIEDQFES